MINFKLFLEDVGLGDIGRSIDRLFNNKHFANQSGAYLNNDGSYHTQTGYIGDPDFIPRLPATNLTIPSVSRTGKITVLLKKKNPIFIKLSDGTEIYLTYDEFKRIKGSEPALGKTMTVIFQRSPDDLTSNHSKIDHISIQD